jgi:signal transduction histidine kinase
MELADEALTAADYGAVLVEYLHERSEQALLRASDLSRIFVESGLGPEDVVALHFESLESVLHQFPYREQGRAIGDASHFLLETMITYGVRYKEYLELKLEREVTDAEMRAMRERERLVEAERSQRESREVLARIAHELRNPITTAKGNLDLAFRSLSMGRVEAASQFVGTAREAVDRLSRLTRELVEASRGISPSLVFSVLDLQPVVAHACAWARIAAANKGVDLTLHPSEGPVLVPGNADALLSVFGNLLSNAIRYTPSSGKVDVRVSFDHATARIDVADTGVGMTPEVKARIFEKFYRAPDAREIESHGLGLGLSLVDQMVAAHQGQIEVESELGQGSVFRVLLPRATSSEHSTDNQSQ